MVAFGYAVFSAAVGVRGFGDSPISNETPLAIWHPDRTVTGWPDCDPSFIGL